MAKRWSYIRAAFVEAGFTSREELNGFTIDSITEVGTDGYYVYYTDVEGDKWRAKFGDTNSPIIVNSYTTSISFSPTTLYIGGVSAYTAAIAVKNQDNVTVTFETYCRTSDATKFTTGGTYGETLTAIGVGTATLSAYHNDGPSATTTITVGMVNSLIKPSGGTIQGASSGTIQLTAGTSYYLSTGLTVKQDTTLLTSLNSTLRYKINSHADTAKALSTVYVSTGTTTKLIVYDVNAYAFSTNYSGATYNVTTYVV